MARMGAVRCTAPALVPVCIVLLLGGGVCASSVRISFTGIQPGKSALQSEAGSTKIELPVEASRPALEDNLGLIAEEALTRVWEQLAGQGEQ